MPPKPAKINITYLITPKLSRLILENSVFEQKKSKCNPTNTKKE